MHPDNGAAANESGALPVTPRRPPQVVCGADFTMAVDDKRDLYSWGLGAYGNLGHGDTNNRSEPTPVESMRGRVRHVAAGPFHAHAQRPPPTTACPWSMSAEDLGELDGLLD